MGLLSSLREKAAKRAAEAARIEEEKKKAELARLTQMSEKELLIEIHLMLKDLEKRISNIESKLDDTSFKVDLIYKCYEIKVEQALQAQNSLFRRVRLCGS